MFGATAAEVFEDAVSWRQLFAKFPQQQVFITRKEAQASQADGPVGSLNDF